MAGIDEAETSVVAWRSANLVVLVFGRVADRELVSGVDRASGRQDQGTHEMVECTARVVKEIPQHYTPLAADLGNVLEDDGVGIVKLIRLNLEGCWVSFNNVTNLGA